MEFNGEVKTSNGKFKIVGTFEVVQKPAVIPKAENADKEKPEMKDIVVKFSDEKIMLLRVCRLASLEDIKIEIRERTGIPIENQRLIHNFEPLEDRPSKALHRLPHGSTIHLIASHLRRIRIYLPNGETLCLELEPSNTIREVETLLRDKLRFESNNNQPVNQLRLYAFSGGLSAKLLNVANFFHSPTILSCGLENGSKIDVFHSTGGPEVLVKTVTARQYAFPFDVTDTCEDLKLKIEAVSGFPAERQRLLFNGKQVESCRKLIEYGISENSVIYQVIATCG